ncbi:aminotransferase class IV [Rarobacter incanus]|uniref:Branched-chain amino acid aminotransferase n=1 Tax=Rarobacter incanus TaxID=153494 RepID=A0A542SNI9_9MICO|nr:aminotransferase class IV [Rarobacter incanus]TQK75817.1 branched-chain amino acid aminotransferase [Rarobacter incanus]
MTAARFWFDGSVRDAAFVAATDHGFTIGDGLFETFVAEGQRVVAFERHLERMATSCRRIELPYPGDEYVRRAVRELLQSFEPGARVRVRATLSSGDGPPGLGRGPAARLLIAGNPAPAPADPVNMVTVPWRRNPAGALSGIKSISKGEDVVAAQFAAARGGNEALWLNTHGQICEGSTTNLFVLAPAAGRAPKPWKLATPPLSSGCLPGIARSLVLERAAGRELSVGEETMDSSIIDHARNGRAWLFVTSAGRGIVPVSSIDGDELPACPQAPKLSAMWGRIAAGALESV